MTTRTLVFDVNETLTDQSLFAARFERVGAAPALAATWYAATLRDGIALSLLDETASYAEVGRAVLLGLLHGERDLRMDVGDAADHIMGGFEGVDPQPDVVDGVRTLAAAGHRLVTLSNGATDVAEGMLTRHGVRDAFELLLTAQDAGAWKPDPRAYAYAADRTGTAAADLVMVAVHPWDLDGAARAGLRTAFVDRTGAPWPAVFRRPDLHVPSLAALADELGQPSRPRTGRRPLP